MKQILLGLSYLHKKGLVHGNLRPGNILFTDKSADHVKLTDYEVGGTKTTPLISKQSAGTFGPHYCAPEVF